MKTEEVFQELYNYLDTQLSNPLLNPYGATLYPYENPGYTMPVIVMKQIDFSFNTENLSHGEQLFSLAIEVNIFAEKQIVAQRTIANSLSDLVVDVLFNQYGMKLDDRNPIPNIDPSIYRIYMRFSCILDENKIIYRTR